MKKTKVREKTVRVQKVVPVPRAQTAIVDELESGLVVVLKCVMLAQMWQVPDAALLELYEETCGEIDPPLADTDGEKILVACKSLSQSIDGKLYALFCSEEYVYSPCDRKFVRV